MNADYLSVAVGIKIPIIKNPSISQIQRSSLQQQTKEKKINVMIASFLQKLQLTHKESTGLL